jgi:hypothetical protein
LIAFMSNQAKGKRWESRLRRCVLCNYIYESDSEHIRHRGGSVTGEMLILRKKRLQQYIVSSLAAAEAFALFLTFANEPLFLQVAKHVVDQARSEFDLNSLSRCTL